MTFLGRMYFASNDGYQNFLVLTQRLIHYHWTIKEQLLTWILTGKMSQEKNKPLDPSLAQLCMI